MLFSNKLILLGGGYSINEGVDLGLWDKIRDKFVIACNASFVFTEPCAVCFLDTSFYLGGKNQPAYKEHLDKCNCLKISRKDSRYDNTDVIQLPVSKTARPRELSLKGEIPGVRKASW